MLQVMTSLDHHWECGTLELHFFVADRDVRCGNGTLEGHVFRSNLKNVCIRNHTMRFKIVTETVEEEYERKASIRGTVTKYWLVGNHHCVNGIFDICHEVEFCPAKGVFSISKTSKWEIA